jgi:hypothetical protein
VTNTRLAFRSPGPRAPWVGPSPTSTSLCSSLSLADGAAASGADRRRGDRGFSAWPPSALGVCSSTIPLPSRARSPRQAAGETPAAIGLARFRTPACARPDRYVDPGARGSAIVGAGGSSAPLLPDPRRPRDFPAPPLRAAGEGGGKAAGRSAGRAAPDAADEGRLWAATPSTRSLRSGSLRVLRMTAPRLERGRGLGEVAEISVCVAPALRPISPLSAEPAIFAPSDSNQIFHPTPLLGAIVAQEGEVPMLSNTRRDS